MSEPAASREQRGPSRPELRLAGHLVEAVSVGGVETCIQFPELKLAFDIGRCPLAAVNRPTVLFTHGHMDHLGGVAYHAATRALRRMPPPTYVIGREYEEALGALFAAWRRLDGSDFEHKLVVIGPGDELELPCKLVARPFRSPHRAPCQGYALWSRRWKLKPEHAGAAGADLAALKARGIQVSTPVDTPEIAFTGDTLIEVVEREESVRRARLLVMEVTFLDERVSVEETRSKGHVHLDEVVERAALFENEALLITHFSARYRPEEVVALLDRKLPRSLRERVTPLVHGRG